MKPFPMGSEEDRETACHEAGHAVAHIRHGIHQAYATIVRHDGMLGSAMAEDLMSVWTKKEAKAQVICYCAGYAACVVARYSDDQANAGCRDDFEEAERIIVYWKLGSLADWKVRAVKFMRRRENVRAVGLVAQHLLGLGTLDSDYMSNLVCVADEETTPAEFEQYLELRRTSQSRPSR